MIVGKASLSFNIALKPYSLSTPWLSASIRVSFVNLLASLNNARIRIVWEPQFSVVMELSVKPVLIKSEEFVNDGFILVRFRG